MGMRQASLGKMLYKAIGSIVVLYRGLENASNKVSRQIQWRNARKGSGIVVCTNLMEGSLDQIPSVGPYPSLLVLNYAMYPPSIVRLAPVMNPASSDARYETKPAISDTSAIRASGIKVFTASA